MFGCFDEVASAPRSFHPSWLRRSKHRTHNSLGCCHSIKCFKTFNVQNMSVCKLQILYLYVGTSLDLSCTLTGSPKTDTGVINLIYSFSHFHKYLLAFTFVFTFTFTNIGFVFSVKAMAAQFQSSSHFHFL